MQLKMRGLVLDIRYLNRKLHQYGSFFFMMNWYFALSDTIIRRKNVGSTRASGVDICTCWLAGTLEVAPPDTLALLKDPVELEGMV